MTGTMVASFSGRDLEVELLDPGSTALVRLFGHPGGDWDPPPEAKRDLRVDPPAGHKGAFAVLYTANTLVTVAIECRVLSADANDHYTWDMQRAVHYDVVRYAFAAPALFIPIDGNNRNATGPRATSESSRATSRISRSRSNCSNATARSFTV